MSRKPSQALREARAEIAALQESVSRYMAEAVQAGKEAQEERERRLAVEEEIEAMAHLCLHTEPTVRYVERKMYKPMPAQEVVRRIHCLVPVETVVERARCPGFFGRIGDRFDEVLSWR